MSLLSRATSGIGGAIANFAGASNVVPTTRILDAGTVRDSPQALYALMRSLALNTSPYQELQAYLASYDMTSAAMQGLRNPTNAVAAFYRANLMPGIIRRDDERSALPLEMSGDLPTAETLRDAIHTAWSWSNLNNQKQAACYDVALLGDQIIRINGNRDRGRAWMEFIQPDYMTELDTDNRGYLTYIRLDVPMLRRNADDTTTPMIHTEIWDKERMRYRRWETERRTWAAKIEQLGTPMEDTELDQIYGTDFVPFVHWQFEASSSSPRGLPATIHALDKILYGDALVTALHQRLTNHNVPDMILTGASMRDPDGFSMPPPPLTAAESVTIDGQTFWGVPGGWQLQSSVPQLDYANHLAVVNAHYNALSQTDLPELAWYQISEAGGDLSGKALNYKLTPAKARVEEARGNADDAIIRATQMVLSVGQNLDIPGFTARDIGGYDTGAFDFWIGDRPIVPLSLEEESKLETERANQVVAYTNAGMALEMALQHAGMSEEEAQAMARADVIDGITL